MRACTYCLAWIGGPLVSSGMFGEICGGCALVRRRQSWRDDPGPVRRRLRWLAGWSTVASADVVPCSECGRPSGDYHQADCSLYPKRVGELR